MYHFIEKQAFRKGRILVEKKWKNIIEHIDYAFQPIVNIHTGICYGVEALMRGQEKAGFQSINNFFDMAFNEKCLFGVDLLLRERAIKKFSAIDFYQKIKLFYNLDNRILLMPDYSPGFTSELLVRYGLNHSSICFEISERHELNFCLETKKAFNAYKKQTYKIAIDDFGTGFSGLQLLYHSEPDFIKIDRFFIADIENDPRKKLFVSNIIKLAHILGIQVIAEGIEMENEFYVCHDIGCDIVQGYFIQRPTREQSKIQYKYEEVFVYNQRNLRKTNSDEKLIQERMEYIEPISYPEHSVLNLLEAFRRKSSATYIPVVNSSQEPLGIVREKDLKEYVYSPYGKELLKNQRLGLTPLTFLTKTPVTDIATKIEQILEIVTRNKNCETIIITENGRYLGLLSMLALLNLLNEKNLSIARDQNPLTKLPGNTIINAYIAQYLVNAQTRQMFVYFDFDNFKPFNDTYGFRRGDRAILIFADILKEISHRHQMFVGHIGGDDFFASVNLDKGPDDQYIDIIQRIVKKFREDVIYLYDAEAKKAGYILAKTREGEKVKVPLLSVSAAVMILGDGTKDHSLEEIAQTLASVKQIAKRAADKVAVQYMGKSEEYLHIAIRNKINFDLVVDA
ncbi:MAG: GGDEF domain-containing protein [Pseudomonadota bacterium]